MEVVLAVDIGGTKLAAGLVDEKGEVVASAQAPTPTTTDADVLFSVLLAVIDSVGGNGDVVGCGVGCGGPMTAGGESVSPLHLPAWRDFPLREQLADATGLPTFVENDGKALALGEGWCGAAAGALVGAGAVAWRGLGRDVGGIR